MRRLEHFGNDAKWSEVVNADLDFHVALVEAGGSRHIAHLYGLLGDEIRLCLAQLRPAYDSVAKLAREHIDTDHPEMERTDDQVRERVAADAYDVQRVT